MEVCYGANPNQSHIIRSASSQPLNSPTIKKQTGPSQSENIPSTHNKNNPIFLIINNNIGPLCNYEILSCKCQIQLTAIHNNSKNEHARFTCFRRRKKLQALNYSPLTQAFFSFFFNHQRFKNTCIHKIH